jgi:hypothetical protein
MNVAETMPNGTSVYGYDFLDFRYYNKLLKHIKYTKKFIQFIKSSKVLNRITISSPFV